MTETLDATLQLEVIWRVKRTIKDIISGNCYVLEISVAGFWEEQEQEE